MTRLNLVIATTRPNFLLLAPICVWLGIAATYAGSTAFSSAALPLTTLCLIFMGALCAAASVNLLNEYWDFRTGLDAITTRTPFSGGSGTLPSHPEIAKLTLLLGIIAFVVTLAIGAYFLYESGAGLLPLGLIGLVIVGIYTPWITGSPIASLIAPGLGFGLLMVMGTTYVLVHEYMWPVLFSALVPFFLVNDLLLLNQYPDMAADRRAGRKNFPILIGRRASSFIYAAFMLFSYGSIVAGIALGQLPRGAWLGLATLPLGLVLVRGVYKNANDMPRLMPYMALNAIACLVTPALLGVGLML